MARNSSLYFEVVWILTAFIISECAVLERKEGDSCGHERVCKKLSHCKSAQEDADKGIELDICTFTDSFAPVVCCRPPNAFLSLRVDAPDATTPVVPKTELSVSQRMCEKYAQYVYRVEESPLLSISVKVDRIADCGRVEELLVVGGSVAKPKEFPHMAVLGYVKPSKENSTITYLCGGSLISERFVLTAAHCIYAPTYGYVKYVLLGDVDLRSNKDDARPLLLKVAEKYYHPKYSSKLVYHDIGLLKLEKDVPLSPHIRPICLQENFEIGQSFAVATGWGKTSWLNEKGSDQLLQVRLEIVDGSICNESYKHSFGRKIPEGIVDDMMLCAGNRAGKDTCNGDSGGPLQIPVNDPYCMYSIIGLTSFGRACGWDAPGVYTRVSYYVPWIESIVWPDKLKCLDRRG